MKRIYKYLSLVAAKLVGRRHPRDVDLPGMKELLNAFISRSDSAITSRPDFNPISESIEAVSDSIEFGGTDSTDDHLNSSFGLYGGENIVFLSTFGQFDEEGASLTSRYGTGTASATSGSSTVIGTNTEWNSNVWPGCIVEFDSSGVKYKIKSVNSDTSITLTRTSLATYTDVSYSISKIHQPDHADYKFNVQAYTSGIIYSSPTIESPVNEKGICGPFYTNITTSTIDYASTEGAFTAGDDCPQEPTGPRSIALGPVGLVKNGMRLVATDSGVEIHKTTDFSDPTSWSATAASPADFTLPSVNERLEIQYLYDGSTYYYVVGGTQTSTGAMAVAITSDSERTGLLGRISLGQMARSQV
jgi:hypothetical protein